MSIATEQLRKFYAKTQPGLSGKQLRAALRYDRKAITRNRNTQLDACIASLFVWEYTTEGADYWLRRDSCVADARW